jgi:hypothetical protein
MEIDKKTAGVVASIAIAGAAALIPHAVVSAAASKVRSSDGSVLSHALKAHGDHDSVRILAQNHNK